MNVQVGPAWKRSLAPSTLLSTLAAALALSCGTPGAKGPAVAITHPAANNQTLRVLDDEDLSTPGLQYTVKADLSNVADGSTAALLMDGVEVAGTARAAGAGEVVFSRVTFSSGSHTVAVRVDDAATGKSASDTRVVQVENIASCVFVSPRDGAVLGAADDVALGTPGVQVHVQVNCPSAEVGAKLTFAVVSPSSFGSVGQVPVEASYGASGATFPAVSLGEGANLLQVQLGDSRSVAQVTVSTGGCAVWITDANDAVYNAQGEQPAGMANPVVKDLNASIAGIQATVSAKVDVAACPSGSSAALVIGGSTLATGQVGADGAVRFSATLPDGDPVKVHVEVTPAGASKAAGVSLENTFRVDSVVPEIELVAPSGTLPPGADKDPTKPGLQVAAVVHVSGGVDPATKVSIKDGSAELLAPQGSLAPDASGMVTLLPDLTLSGGPHQLTAVAQRRLGNIGRSAAVAVDAKIVTLELVSPSKESLVCNAARDEDPTTKDVCELTFQVKVAPADAQVKFEGTGAPAGAVAPVNGVASALYSLPQSAAPLVLTARAADPGVEASLEIHITSVDTVPPTIEFVSPAEGATVTNHTSSVAVKVTGAEAGRAVVVTSDKAPPESPKVGGDFVGPSETLTVGVNLPLGPQTLTASVSDAAGNTATATRGVLVDVDGCDVELLAPSSATFTFNTGNSAGGPAWQYTVRGHTGRCAQGTAHFVKKVGSAETDLGTAAVGANGDFSFDFRPADGEAGAILNVKVTKNLAANAGVDLTYTADFTPPTLDSVAPAQGNLFIVNAGNSRIGQPGYVADADPAAAGGQVAVTLKATGVGSISGSGQGSIAIDSVSPAFSQAYSSNAQQTVQQTLTLAEGFRGPVSVTLKDAAENETRVKLWDATVGTVALPAPALGSPSAGAINVAKDLGGDRATYAVVQGAVSGLPGAGSNAQVVLCTDLQGGGGAACGRGGGYFEIANTLQAVGGTSQFYSAVRLGQGAQKLIAEVRDALGFVADSAPVSVVVDTIPPIVTSVSAVEDANHDGALSATELAPNLPAHLDARFTGVEDGQVASLYEGTTRLATAAVAGGAARFTVDSPAEGQHAYKVMVSDRAGNPNESSSVYPPIANSTDALSLLVQRVAPSITVVAPTFDVCNRALDKNPATQSCELDFTVLVGATATEVDFGGEGSPSPARVTSFVAGRATATYSLGQGGPFRLLATVRDSAGNVREITATVSVDTVAPTISFVSPASDQTLSSQIAPVVVSTDAEAGQVVTVTSSRSGGNTVGQGVVAAGAAPRTASFNVNLPLSHQALSATVSDQAGNVSAPSVVNVLVDIQGCDVNFTNPASASALLNVASGPNLHITGNTTRADCRGGTVTFYASVNGAPETVIGTAAADATSGAFAFDHTFGDGTVTVVSAAMTLGGVTNRSSFTATTDITAPTLTINAPAPNASNQLFVVAQAGNVNVKNGAPGYVADADSAPGGQVSFNVTVVGGASATGTGAGSLTISQGAENKVTRAIGSNGSVALSPLEVILDQAYVGPLTVAVTDAAGNRTSASWAVTVDVVAPGTPQIVMTDPGNGQYTNVVHRRHVDADLVLLTPADDGPAGRDLTWDRGYSTATRLGAASFDEMAFANASVTRKLPPVAAGAVGSTSVAQYRAVPALDTVYLGARVIDSVGNASALASTSLKPWSDVDVDYPGASSSAAARFGQSVVGGGDIDGDSVPDLAVSAPSENNKAGAIYVYSGGAVPPVLLTRLGGQSANAQFGFYMAMGDLNGDRHVDLVAYDKGDIDVFFATQVGEGWTYNSTPSFKFRGTTALTNMTFIPDISGDAIPELAVAEPNAAGSLGSVYVFLGRAGWSSLISSGVVSVSSADLTITGTDAGGKLGSGGALSGLPSFSGDGKGALAVAAGSAKRVYLFSGTTLLSAANLTCASALGPFYATTGNSFGDSSAIADLNGDSRPDFFVGDGGQGYVYAYLQNSDHTFTIDPAAAPMASGANYFGTRMIQRDISGDGLDDLVIGGSTTLPGFATLLWSSASGLSTSNETVIEGGNSYANYVLAADVTGDGLVDLVSATPVGGLNGNGKITIRY